MSAAAKAVLLVNLGSPDSPSVPDVRRYLREFLGDERVLDLPKPLRWLLLEGIILRTRPKKSAHAYQSVWTPEGAPLLVISERVRRALAAACPLPVVLGMRYGKPSAADAIAELQKLGVRDVLLFPQYPHYAMSSWETVVVKFTEEARRLAPELGITTVQPFYNDPVYIEALYASAKPHLDAGYDHLLISYHGIPARHLKKADSSRAHCLVAPDCCATCSPAQSTCYRAHCMATTKAFAQRAQLSEGKYSVSFQSRLAGEPWLEPFTDFELKRLPKAGVRKLLVMCPAFTADCLETIEEISVEGRDTFLENGGKEFLQIPCLNDHPAYIEFLARRVDAWSRS